MHRAKTNTSLDERALTEAAKALEAEWLEVTGMCIGDAHEMSEAAVEAYLATLPEPPLDEWLKEKHAEAIRELGQARSNQPEYIRWNARVVAFDEALEALAEHRKEGQHG